MTEFLDKLPSASFETDHDDGVMRVSDVIETRMHGVPNADRLFVAEVSPEAGDERRTLAALLFNTRDTGTFEIKNSWEVGSKKEGVTPRVLAMLAETAFHGADLRGDRSSVRVRVPRDSDLPHLYAHTLGMRPVFISEGETEVTLRADVRTVRGWAAESLRTAATRRLSKPREVHAKGWDEAA